MNETDKYSSLRGLTYEQRRLRLHEKRLLEYGITHISSPANEVQSRAERKRTAQALRYNFEMLDRKVYVTDKSEAASVGLVPLYLQIMSGRYSGGIGEVVFRHKNDGSESGRLVIGVREGGETCGLPVGFDKPAHCELKLGGEVYKLAVKGKFAYYDDGNTVLKIRLSFVEYASARYIRFVFSRGGKVTMKLSETPGRDYVETLLRDMLNSMTLGSKPSREHPFIDAAMTQLDDGYVSYRLMKLLEPELELFRK